MKTSITHEMRVTRVKRAILILDAPELNLLLDALRLAASEYEPEFELGPYSDLEREVGKIYNKLALAEGAS